MVHCSRWADGSGSQTGKAGSQGHRLLELLVFASFSTLHLRPLRPLPRLPAVLRVKVGASAHSSLWLYYVPSQAVSGIKLRVLGVGALI